MTRDRRISLEIQHDRPFAAAVGGAVSEDTARSRKRKSILGRMKRLRDEIELDLNTAAHWNECIRKPNEALIDYDPDGKLRRIMEGIDRVLGGDKGQGPIAQFQYEIARGSSEVPS